MISTTELHWMALRFLFLLPTPTFLELELQKRGCFRSFQTCNVGESRRDKVAEIDVASYFSPLSGKGISNVTSWHSGILSDEETDLEVSLAHENISSLSLVGRSYIMSFFPFVFLLWLCLGCLWVGSIFAWFVLGVVLRLKT